MGLTICLRNEGTQVPPQSKLRVWIPNDFGFALPVNQFGRRGRDGDCELIERDVTSDTIDRDPERPTPVFSFPLPRMNEAFDEQVFRFRLVGDGQLPQTSTFNYGDLRRAADKQLDLSQ